MKRILLASTAIVAFAGAAAAEVTFSGDAEIGFNDSADYDKAEGFYYSFGLTVKGTMELDNGLTVTMSGDVELENDGKTNATTFDGNDVHIDDLVLTLSSDTASLSFGDTKTAAEKHWSAVGNMESDGFYENDDASDAKEEGVLIGEMTFGGTTVAMSQVALAPNGDNSELKNMQLAVVGSMGTVSYGLAYEDDEATGDEIVGVRVGTTFGGADVALGYADNGKTESLGVSVDYDLGNGVKVGAFYVGEDSDDNWGVSVAYASGPLSVDALYHDGTDEDMQINVSYDMGNGVTLFGGYRDEGENAKNQEQAQITYVGADYDLGGGATARFSYVDVELNNAGKVDTAADEFGPGENLKEGMTVEVAFTF